MFIRKAPFKNLGYNELFKKIKNLPTKQWNKSNSGKMGLELL